jgi:hypothetical protein
VCSLEGIFILRHGLKYCAEGDFAMAEKDGILRVEWQGPLTLDEVAKLQKPMDAGLYAIYGPHVI